MTILRSALVILVLFGLAVLLIHGNAIWLAVVSLCAFCISVTLLHNIRHLAPVLLFCAVLAVLEWIGHRSVSALPLKAFVSYLLLALAFRLMPWGALMRLISPRSRFFPIALFFLFLRHFTLILLDEAFRSLTAYRLTVLHPFRRRGIQALAHSLDSFFRRCLTRAERFYAAQLLRGLAE